MTGKLIGNLLHAGTVAHIHHLTTRSFAEHDALGKFYEGIPGLVDQLAEVIQGAEGVIGDWPKSFPMVEGECEAFIRSLREEVEEGRADLPEDSHVQNIVDEILALIDVTLDRLGRT